MQVVYLIAQPNDTISIWENLHLIKTQSEEEAWKEAEAIGKSSEVYDGFCCDGRPAQLKFAGIRKLHSLEGLAMKSRVELSAMQIELATEADLKRLLLGESVAVLCYDDFKSLK